MTQTRPTLTLASLERLDGAAEPEPFTFGIESHLISFPDPLALSVEESEAFMADLEGTRSLSGTLRRWLPEEDAELLIRRLSARQGAVLMRAVNRHYTAFLGDAGEGTASGTA